MVVVIVMMMTTIVMLIMIISIITVSRNNNNNIYISPFILCFRKILPLSPSTEKWGLGLSRCRL